MSDRDDSWLRRKRHGESWPRYCAEVPPELAAEIDAAQRGSLGVNATDANATRANAVRAGLRLYLEATAPEREAAIEGTCVELLDRPALTKGTA